MIKKALILSLLLMPAMAMALSADDVFSPYEPLPGAHDHMTLDEVRALMIKESVAANPECPCPYSPDKIGGNCGTHCQYYGPGGYRVKCFMMDIPVRDIYFFKQRKAYTRPE